MGVDAISQKECVNSEKQVYIYLHRKSLSNIQVAEITHKFTPMQQEGKEMLDIL